MYDDLVARVDVHEIGAIDAGPHLERAGGVAASSSPAAGSQSTTPAATFVVTNMFDIAGANFAQTMASRTFSSGGMFAGQSIDDVVGALRSSGSPVMCINPAMRCAMSGAMSAKDVPVQVIVRMGTR